MDRPAERLPCGVALAWCEVEQLYDDTGLHLDDFVGDLRLARLGKRPYGIMRMEAHQLLKGRDFTRLAGISEKQFLHGERLVPADIAAHGHRIDGLRPGLRSGVRRLAR